MDALYALQLERLEKIENCYKVLIAKEKPQQTQGAGEAQKSRLEHYFALAEEDHANVIRTRSKPLHAYFIDKVMDKIEDAFYLAKGQFNDYFRDLRVAEQAAQPVPPALNNTIANDSTITVAYQNLPKMDISQFSGEHSDWETFRDVYRSLIHRCDAMSLVDKFYFLRTHVQGKALDIIKGYPLSATHYEQAWTDLMTYYENKRRLVNTHLSSFFAVQPMKAESASALNKLIKESLAPLDALKAMGRPVPQWSDLLVYIITSRFDGNTLREWQRKQGNSTDPPTFEELKEFMDYQLVMLEAMECKVSDSTGPTKWQGNASASKKLQKQSHQTVVDDKTDNQKISKTCALCSANHFIFACPSFRAKSVTERKDFILSKRLCVNCLGNHTAKKCASQRKCSICQKRHNTLLHFGSSMNPKLAKGQEPSVHNTLVTNSQDKIPVIREQPANFANQISQLTLNHSLNPAINEFQYKPVTHCSSAKFSSKGVLLATALVRVSGQTSLELTVRALIDPCSQSSFISESLCQRLRLKGHKIHAPIMGTGGNQVALGKKCVSLKLQPHFQSKFSYQVDAIVLSHVSSYAPPSVDANVQMPHLKGLQLADPQFMERAHIDILLGATFYSQIIEGTVIKGSPSEPIAVKSTLGWLISGNVPTQSNAATTPLTSLHVACEEQVDCLIRKFWEQEEVPKIQSLSPNDQACEDHFSSTHSRDSCGRYIVRLPFKNGLNLSNLNLGESVYKSRRMLINMENKFLHDTKLKDAYCEFLQDYESLGHMYHHSPLELSADLRDSFFLPHHGVWKESSTTTKLRTVFNGSSKLPTVNVSLNDLLYAGPNLLPNLADLTCAWRRYRHVFVSDVEKMYRQILVHPDDWKYQSILWRNNQAKPIQIYRLTTVTYGISCSAFLASRVLKQLAIDYRNDHPLGSDVLHSEVYMDDVLSGGHDLSEAIAKMKDTLELCKVGGFKLRKWLASSSDLLGHITPEDLSTGCMDLFQSNDTTAVLGIAWQPGVDMFCFNLSSLKPPVKLTKRTILSYIAKIFDPLGWVSPIVILAKILMQSLWLLKIDWDSTIPSEVALIWNRWIEQLSFVSHIRIPRWNRFTPEAQIVELHGFADASKTAYGAVLYLRVVNGSNVTTSLDVAKSKVSPLKLLSIPRLELCAAHLLTKLAHHYRSSTSINLHSVHLWTDSSDVLHWLKAHPSEWQTFIANRCSEIHDLLHEAQWHHIRSSDNPADILSRGRFANELADEALWWHGPSCLVLNSQPWPNASKDVAENVRRSKNLNSEIERKNIKALPESCILSHNCVAEGSYWDVIFRFSSCSRLLRVTAYVIRFVLNVVKRLKTKGRSISLNMIQLSFINTTAESQIISLSPFEINRALNLWILFHQKIHFASVISKLKKGQLLKGGDPLAKLDPLLVSEFLRVGGRLSNSVLDSSQKHPVILFDKDPLTTLLIRRAHLQVLHGGTQTTLSTLRLQFWIVRGRNAVKAVIQRCLRCQRYSRHTLTQKMGDLPEYRVNPTLPFKRAGIDYAGPINVRLTKARGKGTLKGYIALFVCMVTRAVHLELVEDYTAESFIAAFHRFVARRGHCSDLFSDQGTNFIGADSSLRRLFSEFATERSEVFRGISAAGTTWHFNPPSAPHFGGLWESAVKSAKTHLKRVVGDQTLTFSELSTLLCRIESILNSRPLIPLTDDPTDLMPLTPAHFLILRNSYVLPEPDLTTKKIPLGKRWENISQLVQHFWMRWSSEYLTSLQPRKKWLAARQSLQINDLVLITNEITAPTFWPLGRVTALHPGKDGLVRVAEIKTATTSLLRPVTKLILLRTAYELLTG